MLNEICIKTIKQKDNYISECEVLDTQTKEKYYVVSQMPSTMYATFNASYIDYLLKKSKKPTKIEGENYMFFDFDGRLDNTRFSAQYKKTYNQVLDLKHKNFIYNKYSKIKKPKDLSKIVLKEKNKSLTIVGYNYQLQIEDNNERYKISTDELSNYKIYKILNNKEIMLETLHGFNKTKKSKYYSYYLLIELYKDDYLNWV